MLIVLAMTLSIVAAVTFIAIPFVQDYRYNRKMERLKARMYRQTDRDVKAIK